MNDIGKMCMYAIRRMQIENGCEELAVTADEINYLIHMDLSEKEKIGRYLFKKETEVRGRYEFEYHFGSSKDDIVAFVEAQLNTTGVYNWTMYDLDRSEWKTPITVKIVDVSVE